MTKVVYLSFAQSSFYTKIDYALLAKSVSAVMIRGGQGIWEDAKFKEHYDGCVKNNIPFGIWWFCQPDMVAQYQIDAFMKLWNRLEIKPKVIAYDVEEIDYQDNDGKWKKLFPPSRQFSHDNVLAWCRGVKNATNGTIGIYTRKNYFESWTFETKEWYDYWMWIAAWYLYTGEVKPLLPWNWPTYKLHQFEGGGLGTPGVDPINTCKEYFNGTVEECKEFFGANKEVTMASVYNKQVTQANRAKLIKVDAKASSADMNLISKSVDAVILTMGGMDGIKGSGKELYAESGYDVRVKQLNDLNIPVIAEFKLDAGYWLWKQKDLNTPSGSGVEQMLFKDNPVIQLIMNQLSKGSVSGLILNLGETVTHTNVPITDVWQKGTLLNILDQILINKDIFPDIKIFIQSNPWFLESYPNQLATYLHGKKDQVYMSLGQWIFDPIAGPHVANLDIVFNTWRPAETFKYKSIPFGYYQDELVGNKDRVMMHWYSSERFFVDGLLKTNSGGQVPLDTYVWCDTKEKLLEFLGAPVVTPPTVEPPITTDLESRVTVLESELKTLVERISKLENWKNTVL